MKNLNFCLIKKVTLFLILSSLMSCGVNEDSTVITPTLIGKGDLSGTGGEGIPQQNIGV